MDAAGCLLWSVAREYERADAGELRSTGFQLRVNEVKVLASETAHAVVDDAMDLLGATNGYTVNDRIPLERVYRDLRAARLMYSNDRLLEANGKLALIDTGLGARFS
jgi:alkylation response protein AidB-like acyl-CoA dehydrogenase